MVRLETKSLIAGLALAAGALAVAAHAGAATIAQEDFDGGVPNWSNDIAAQQFQDPSEDPGEQGLFIRETSGDNANFSGNAAFGQDLDGESGEPEVNPIAFTFDNVDTSDFTDISVSFDYAVSANADTGNYTVVIDGVDQGPVEYYNDPDSGVVTGTAMFEVGAADTVGLRLGGSLNGGNDTLELDNFTLSGHAVPEPASFALLGLGGLAMLGHRRRKA